MPSYRLTGTLLLAALLLGCQNKPPVAPPVSRDAIRTIRESYQRLDPTARLGAVVAVDEPTRLVAVGDVTPSDFTIGDVVNFMDSKESLIGVGRVLAITTTAVHVKYEQPGPKQRAPRVGDLALRVRTR